jgi:tetratricopeptide (TPR) repeat protein/serine/threonine protein kinase
MTPAADPIELILAAAVEIPGEAERRAYVERACAGDADLRRRVDELIDNHLRAGSFLESPAPDLGATADQPVGERPGTVIGPYKLLEQIGEGGFGTVFLAEQTAPVRRKVALKVIKPGMDTAQVIARFEAERQALAVLDHPNIAKVFDGGQTPTGRPYFVMELVRGVPVTDFCDQNHLPPRDRLDLFVAVCQAVQHAHQKGIIHRDLKPSNVLVSAHDGRPAVKVIDFGIAKATGRQLTDKTLFTGFAQMVGTPLYMSPEQAAQSPDVDTRSDVYSLGVLLYELLTGSTPFPKERFKQAAYDEIRRIIREEDPPRPSTRLSESQDALPSISAQRHTEPAKLTRLVRGELDWIVMRALEKDRNRRYETANAFAADVQRYLADERVLACPPSAGYRLAKFVRRNKATMFAAGVTFLALVAGMVGTTLGLVRALDAEKTARTAEDHERQAKLLAEKNLEQALKSADTFFTRVSESKLLDKPSLQPFRKELLKEAQKHYLELFNKQPDNPKLKAELAASYLRILTVLTALEEGPQAIQDLEKGLDLIESLVKQHPGDRDLMTRLAGVCQAERPMFRGWADGLSRSNMSSHLQTLERACALWKKLVDDYPDVAELEADYAVLLMYEGDLQFAEDRYREGQRLYEASDARLSRLLRASALSSEYRIHAAFARSGVAWHLQHFGHVPEAIEKYAECIKMFEDQMRLFPEKVFLRWAVLGVQSDMVDCLNYASRPQEAEALRGRVIQGAEKLVTEHPDVPVYAVALSYMYAARASAEESNGRTQAAEAEMRKSLRAIEKTVEYYPDHPWVQASLASQYSQLGWFYVRRGEPERALQLTEQAVSTLRKASTAEDPAVLLRLGEIYFQRAVIDRSLARPEHAEKAYRAAINNQSRYLSKFTRSLFFSPDLHGSCAGLYDLLKSAGRTREADDFIRDTIAAWENLARDDPDRYEFRLQVAQTYAVAGKWDKAAEEYTKAIGKWPHRVDLWRGRASAYSKLARHDEAVKDYTALIEFGYRDPSRHSWMFHDRASAFRALKQDEHALADFSQAIKYWPFLVEPWVWRGNMYRDLGHWTKAVDDFSKAIQLNPATWGNWYQRGLCHVQLKQWDAALSDFTKVVELQPDQAQGLVDRLLTAKRDEEGEKLLRLSVTVLERAVADPSPGAGNLLHLGQCYRLLAQLLEKSGRQQDRATYLGRAIDIFAKLAQEQPATASHRDLLAWSRFDLGVRQWQLGETDAAARNLYRASEMWTRLAADVPSEPAYLMHAVNAFAYPLGPLLQEQGRAAEAEQFLARTIPEWRKLAREDREEHRNVLADATGLWARLLVGLGKQQQAEQLAAEVVEQLPNNAHAMIARGRVRLDLGQPGQALEDFEKAIRLAPTDGGAPWWWLDRAFAHIALKQDDKALAGLTAATERWPQLWDAWVWRGDFHFDRQRWKEAIADYTQGLARNPRYAAAWRHRGYAGIWLGDWDRAIQDYDKAISLQPTDAGVHQELAWLLAHCPDHKFRNPKRAVELARRAVSLDPKNVANRGTLGSAHYRAGDWNAAIEELKASIKLRQHGADMLFLAMAHKRLRQDTEARQWYDRAVEWIEKNAKGNEELLRFRVEAEEVLKIEKRK